MSDWISVKERLPELHQPVVCIDVTRHENTGGDWLRFRQDCCYLSEFGTKYWSKYGERGMVLDAYTHWMPLPPPPEGAQGG